MADQNQDRKFHRVAHAVEDLTPEQEKFLDRPARWTRVGVSFLLKNGYERVRLSPGVSVHGQIILAPPKDDELIDENATAAGEAAGTDFGKLDSE